MKAARRQRLQLEIFWHMLSFLSMGEQEKRGMLFFFFFLTPAAAPQPTRLQNNKLLGCARRKRSRSDPLHAIMRTTSCLSRRPSLHFSGHSASSSSPTPAFMRACVAPRHAGLRRRAPQPTARGGTGEGGRSCPHRGAPPHLPVPPLHLQSACIRATRLGRVLALI